VTFRAAFLSHFLIADFFGTCHKTYAAFYWAIRIKKKTKNKKQKKKTNKLESSDDSQNYMTLPQSC
jgi:hypothetical protein